MHPTTTNNLVTEEVYGNASASKPDVVLISQHDGSPEQLLEKYPQLLEPYKDDPQALYEFLELERDIRAAQITRETAIALNEISQGAIRIDLVSVDNISRGIIDPNRLPLEESDAAHNPSGVDINPVRNIFDHESNPELLEEFKEIHRRIVSEIRAKLDQLGPGGLFLDVHVMNDNDPKETNDRDGTKEVSKLEPTPESLREYIHRYTAPENQGRQRKVNLLTRFPKQAPIAHSGLVGSLERKLGDANIETERDHPYSYLGFSMCSQFALQKPHQGTTVDIPVREISKDGKADNIHPEIEEARIMRIARLQAEAIWENLQA